MRRLPDAMLLPAHGQVTLSVRVRVDELVDHRGRRHDEVERKVDADGSFPYKVARRLT